MDRLWTLREEPAGRRGLSAARIVDAAIDLADEQGLAAVSMSRVASRLGAGTMSLYRHVENKDELLTLMVDVAISEPAGSPPPGDEGWRPALERWAWDLRGVVQRHPWLLDVPLPQRPLGPGRAAWLERGLAALAPTRLDEGVKAGVVLLVNGFVFSEARVAAEVTADPLGLPRFSAGLADLVPGERFPALRRAIEGGIFDDPFDAEAGFAFGLARLLDGVAALVADR